MTKLAITSVYANPIHPGHVECFELSKTVAGADELWVIVNNDKQAEAKRKVPSFQDEQYRCTIVGAIRHVDRVFLSIDEVDKRISICQSLRHLILEARESGRYEEIIFTKGGDRFAGEVPETALCRELGVLIVDGLGAKTHNSSDYAKKK